MTQQHSTDSQTTSQTQTAKASNYRSPALAVAAIALTLGAWCMLMWLNGYVAMAVALAAVVAGFAGMPGRSNAVKNVAITAIIASTVLIVVLAAFLIVIKIGLGSVA